MTELRDQFEDPDVLTSELVYTGRVWDVRHEAFSYNGSSVTRDFVDHTGAVAILAMDERDRVLLIRQYRHPVRARLWEIPAGLLDVNGEKARDAAERELAEEADLEATTWSVLADYYTSPGGSDEAIRIFLATGISERETRYERQEEEADIEKCWIPLDAAVDAVRDRTVQNPSLVTAVLSAFVEKQRGWSGLADADTPWPQHRPRGGGV